MLVYYAKIDYIWTDLVNEKELYRLTTSYEIPYDAFDKYGWYADILNDIMP